MGHIIEVQSTGLVRKKELMNDANNKKSRKNRIIIIKKNEKTRKYVPLTKHFYITFFYI